MSTFTTISSDKLTRLIGTANAPVLIDVRTDEDFAADPRLIPGSIKLSHDNVSGWGSELSGRSAIVACLRGAKLAQGTAAWLRQLGVQAETLEGGFEGWKDAKLPLVGRFDVASRARADASVEVVANTSRVHFFDIDTGAAIAGHPVAAV